MNKKIEYEILLIESGKETAESFVPAEYLFHFVSIFVQLTVVFSYCLSVFPWLHFRNHAKLEIRLTCFLAFIGIVHNHCCVCTAGILKLFQKLAALRSIARLTGRQRKRYGAAVAFRHHVNLGTPSFSNITDKLKVGFIRQAIWVDFYRCGFKRDMV